MLLNFGIPLYLLTAFFLKGNRGQVTHVFHKNLLTSTSDMGILHICLQRDQKDFQLQFNNLTVQEMKYKNVETAWLPIRKTNYGNWRWTNGKIYAQTIGHPATGRRGMDCAVLRSGDQMFVDVYCNNTYSHIMCLSKGDCSSIKGAEVCVYLTVENKSYAVYKYLSTWFEAKMKCLSLGSVLAYITQENMEFVLRRVSMPWRKIWIGLRQADYYYVRNGKQIEVRLYFWPHGGPSTSTVLNHCVVMQRGQDINQYYWKPEDCRGLSQRICAETKKVIYRKEQSEGSILESQKTGVNLGIIVGPILALASLLVIGLLLRFRHKITECCNISQNRPEDRDVEESSLMPKTDDEAIIKPGQILPEAEEIRNKLRDGTPRSPLNILLVGQSGSGKSSLINSLNTVLDRSGYHEYTRVGFGGGRQITRQLIPVQVRAEGGEESRWACKPVFWDFAGLLNKNEDRVLTYLLTGNLEDRKTIDEVRDWNLVTRLFDNFWTKPIRERRMHLVIYVQSIEFLGATQLLRSVNRVTSQSKTGPGVRVIAVFTMTDLIKRKENQEEEEDRVKELEEYVTNELQIVNAPFRSFRITSYTDDTIKHGRRVDIERNLCNLWNAILDPGNYVDFN